MRSPGRSAPPATSRGPGTSSEVFGLTTEDTPIPQGGFYTQSQKDGKNVAGLTPLQDQEREQGIPPHWNTYITVEDAELAAKEAERLRQ